MLGQERQKLLQIGTMQKAGLSNGGKPWSPRYSRVPLHAHSPNQPARSSWPAPYSALQMRIAQAGRKTEWPAARDSSYPLITLALILGNASPSHLMLGQYGSAEACLFNSGTSTTGRDWWNYGQPHAGPYPHARMSMHNTLTCNGTKDSSIPFALPALTVSRMDIALCLQRQPSYAHLKQQAQHSQPPLSGITGPKSRTPARARPAPCA